MIGALPSVLLVTFGAVLGAIFGSFIATLVIRWPAGRSVATGRSLCDGCGKNVAAFDLVPILSYAARRGRARCCGGRIDPLHPCVEIAAAMIGALAFLVAPLAMAIGGAVFGWTLLALALLDLRHFWLPDRLTSTLAILAVLAALAGLDPPLTGRLIGGIAGYLALTAIGQGYKWLRHRDGLGGGDAKLFGAIGLWTGWQALPPILLGGSLLGLVYVASSAALGRKYAATSRLPLGVFLSVAAWAYWLIGAMIRG